MQDNVVAKGITPIRYRIFEDHEWSCQTAKLIENLVSSVLQVKQHCSIVLTGGHSAEQLYRLLGDVFTSMVGSIAFFFGDERCVAVDSIDSNYKMVKESLFAAEHLLNVTVYRIIGEHNDHREEAERYADLLPDQVDIVLLSMGEDGHIASIFPNDRAAIYSDRKVVAVTGTKKPFERITVTPMFIQKARHTIGFICGATKTNALEKMISTAVTAEEIPAKLVTDCEWCIDRSAASSLLT